MSTPIVLVTGAPGWLGSRLVESLALGLPEVDALREPLGDRVVRCLVLPGSDTAALRAISPKVQVLEGDITNSASVAAFVEGARGATMFHAAGVVHPTRGTKQFREVNVEGTRNLLAAATSAGARRFVYVSSNSPIGTNPTPDHRFDEASPYDPYMGYGASKKEAEIVVNAAGARGEIETVIVRPPWFYGPGQPERQSLFFSMIRTGKVPIVGDGNNYRSMVYVDNLCQGLLLAERVQAAAGGTYWIADRDAYTMNTIVDTIERLLETSFGMTVAHKRMRLPGIMSEVALLADKMIQGVGLYHQKVHVLSEMNKTIACSVARAERELGYAPKVALEEGMKRSITWALAQGHVI